MSFWDSVVSSYDSVTTSIGDTWDSGLDSVLDYYQEDALNSIEQKQIEQTALPVTTQPTSSQPFYASPDGGINWQMVGAGIAGLGLLVTLYKVVK